MNAILRYGPADDGSRRPRSTTELQPSPCAAHVWSCAQSLRKVSLWSVTALAAMLCGLSGCSESTATTASAPRADGPKPVSASKGAASAEEEGVTMMWEMTPEGLERAKLPWKEAAELRRKEITVRDLPRISNSIGMEFVEIPAGEFQMGSPDGDLWAMPDEKPMHAVRIERPFYCSVYEVTVGQFEEFVNDTNYKTAAEASGKGGFSYDAETQRLVPDPASSWRYTGFKQDQNHPVVNINWDDANAFCDWLGRKEGIKYRLPTEQEWEYACRGGTTTYWYTGSTEEAAIGTGNICDRRLEEAYPFANWSMAWEDGYAFTAPVGSYPPNPFGLHDMIGNVFEWCGDRWKATNYEGVPVPDPNEPDIVGSRIVRGGSFLSLILFTRSADRVALKAENRAAITGFRCIREIAPNTTSRS